MRVYEDLNVWIGPEVIQVSSSWGEAGTRNTVQDLIHKLPISLDNLLRQRSIEKHSRQAVGIALFDILFNAKTLDILDETIQLAAHQDRGVRIILDMSTAPQDVLDLPWEWLFDQRKKLFLVTSSKTLLVRYARQADLFHQVAPPVPPLRLLFTAAAPQDLPQLPVNKVQQIIENVFSNLKNNGIVEYEVLPSTTIETFVEHLNKGWNIVHLMGHGYRSTEYGQMSYSFEDDHHAAAAASADELTALFKNRNIQLVILDACYSATLAPALVRMGIPWVIGLNYPVSHEDSNMFLRTFYSAMIDGFVIDQAVAEGRKSLFLTSQSESISWGSIVVYASDLQTTLFRYLGEELASHMTHAGEVIYTGGGVATKSGVTAVTGDYISGVNIASTSSLPKDQLFGGTITKEPQRAGMDRTALKQYLRRLEKTIVTNRALSSSQRLEGFAVLEKLERSLAVEQPDQVEVRKLCNRLSMLNMEVADASRAIWSLVFDEN